MAKEKCQEVFILPPLPPPPLLPLLPPPLPPPLLLPLPLPLPPQLGRRLLPRRRPRGSRAHRPSCLAARRTTWAAWSWASSATHRTSPSTELASARLSQPPSRLRTTSSCRRRCGCQFCARTWSTCGSWVGTCQSRPQGPSQSSLLYVSAAAFGVPLVLRDRSPAS